MNHEKLKKNEKNKIVLKEESYQFQGAIFEVYKTMGPGFLESVYKECLKKEFEARNIPYSSEVDLNLKYKYNVLNLKFRADLICYNSILIELTAVNQILDIHRAQVLNYLKATDLKLALLANFNSHPRVEIERIVL